MLKTLVQIVRGQHHNRYLYHAACLKTLPCSRNFVPICRYGTKRSVIEEETLSYKVLEHIRGNAVYTALPYSLEKQTLSSKAIVDEKYAIKQILLVIAHNPEIKVNDILQLFSLYASSQQFIMQNVISDKSLMKSVKSKVTQSLHLMKVNELQQLALSLRELKNQKISYLKDISKNIGQYCEQKAQESDLPHALELFDILVILYGNRISRRYEYDTFMSLFETTLSSAQPQDIVKILHYVGLGKSRRLSKEFANKAISKLEPDFHALTFSDAGIAAGGIFKIGLKVDKSSRLVCETSQHLKLKIKKPSTLSELEGYALVSMIKLLRVANYKDNELLSHLSGFILKADESYLSTPVVPHLLAFYANSRVYEKEIFSKIEKVIFEHLRKPSHIRIRDFTRLLWCFSHTGHECSTQLLQQIDKYLLNFAHGSEIAKDPHLLSDALFSLGVCGHYPIDLIKKAFTPVMVRGLQGYQRSKQLSRLLMLYECLQVEVPELTIEKPSVSEGDLPVRTLSDEVYHRPGLAKLMEGAKFVNKVVGANVFKLKFLLPHINYANLVLDFGQLETVLPVTISTESFNEQDHIIQQLSLIKEHIQDHSVAIELLESDFLIQPSSRPIGIVGLKLRLLQQRGWGIKVLLYSELEQCEDDTRAIAALLIDRLTKCN